MPVEIKELLIEINVVSDDSKKSESKGAADDQSQLLKDYIQQVMQTVDNKKER